MYEIEDSTAYLFCANVLLDKLEHGTLRGCTGINMMQDREQIQIDNNRTTYHYEIGNFYNETGLETQVWQKRRTPKISRNIQEETAKKNVARSDDQEKDNNISSLKVYTVDRVFICCYICSRKQQQYEQQQDKP